MLGTIRDGIDGAAVGVREFLQATFEQDDQLALPGRRRAIEQENALADIGAGGSCFEVFHHFRQRVVNPKEFPCEEVEAFIPLVVYVHTVGADHIVDASMGQLRELGVLKHHREIVAESAVPMTHTKFLGVFIDLS